MYLIKKDDIDISDIDGHDTEVAFKALSLTSISAFVMMFGWGGLAAYKEYFFNSSLSILFATIVGIISLFATAYLFKLAINLKRQLQISYF